MTHKEIVTEYINGVLSGAIVAGRLVKLAVRRHVADLEKAGKRGFYFDEAIAEEACSFFPNVLRHSVGEWDEQPFVLSPWQVFIVWCLFGWRRMSDGMRRFRKALIEIARKNGKSTFAAGLVLLVLFFDNPIEPGAEAYVAATKEDQAKIVHREATRMVKKSPSLDRMAIITKNNIAVPRTNSFFRPIGSDSDKTDGLNPAIVVKDELHAWLEYHRGLYEKLGTGGASRRQPLDVTITTAGDDDSRLWQEEEDYAVAVLESVVTGQIVSDTYFAFIAKIDDARTCEACDGQGCGECQEGILAADEPLDEKVWMKANPNLGTSVKLDYLREQANEARNKPSALNAFIRYHANRRCSSNERAIKMDFWKRCGGPLSDEWSGSESYGGFDLGRKSDLASLAIACKFADGEDSEGKERFRTELRQWSFTHEQVDLPLHQEPWATFIRTERLFVNSGNVIDLPGAFKDKLLEVTKEFNVVQWAYDPNNAAYLAIELTNEYGMECYEFRQSHGMYNETMEEFLNSVKTARVRHGDDLLLTFAAQNLVINKNSKNEWMPKKDSSTGKIDPIVAAIMAFGGAMKADVTSGYWDPRIGV